MVAGLNEKKILVVAEEKAHRDMISDYMKKSCSECQSAHDYSEAIDILSGSHFDFVISDVQIGDQDGLQFVQDAGLQFPHLKFVMLASRSPRSPYSSIVASGADDFIVKPFKMEQLKARLDKITRDQEAFTQLSKANDELLLEARLNDFFMELLKSLISQASFDIISQLVLDCTILLTSSGVGYIGYLNATTGGFTVVACSEDAPTGCRADNKDSKEGMHSALWNLVSEKGQSILTNRPVEDPGRSGMQDAHPPITRFLASPARSKERVIGMIAVANAPEDYTEGDLAIATKIADIYALAIQRKWAEEDLSRAREELKATRDELAKIAEERSAQLTRTGELLRRSIETMRDVAQRGDLDAAEKD